MRMNVHLKGVPKIEVTAYNDFFVFQIDKVEFFVRTEDYGEFITTLTKAIRSENLVDATV